MNILKVTLLHGDTERSIRYCRNARKTVPEESRIGRRYVYGINCSPDRAAREWDAVRERYGKTGGVTALSVIQGFPEGGVTPEAAHSVGIRTARAMWGSRFQILVCTHLDKPHPHNHILVCSTSFADGKKLCGEEVHVGRIREAFRDAARSAGLKDPGPEPNGSRTGRKHPAAAAAEAEGRMTLTGSFRWDILRAADASLSMTEFRSRLAELGYAVAKGRRDLLPRTFRPPGSDRTWRFDSLGEDCSPPALLRRIHENTRRVPLCSGEERESFLRVAAPLCDAPPGEDLSARLSRYVQLLCCVDDHPRAAFPLPVPVRIALFSLSRKEEHAKTAAALGVRTPEELQERIFVSRQNGDALARERRLWRDRIRLGRRRWAGTEEGLLKGKQSYEALKAAREEYRNLRGAEKTAKEADRDLDLLTDLCREAVRSENRSRSESEKGEHTR